MKKLFLLFLFSFISFLSFATHLRGGHISVTRNSPGSLSCTITVTVFTDTNCAGCVLFGGAQDIIDFGDGTQLQVPETPNTPLPGFAGVGFASFTIQHTYAGVGSYTISYSEPNRNEGIRNMDNSINTLFYIETTIDLGPLAGFVSTPQFLLGPIFQGKLGSDLSISAGAISNQDYIVLYQLGTPQMDRETPVNNYRFPENIQINPFTGLITWDTKFDDQYRAGEFAFNVKVHLYKEVDNQLIKVCTVSKDIQIILEDVSGDVTTSTNTVLDENNRVYIPANDSKTIKIFFEKENIASPLELTAYSELHQNEDAFSFTTYDSTTAPNIKVGVLTLTSLPDIDRENPYLITVRGKYGSFAKDVPFLFFTQDLQPKFIDVITKTEDEQGIMEAYPNPTKDYFTISLLENQSAQIYVRDQTGNVIQSIQATGTTTLDLRHLPSGFYYCTVLSGSGRKQIKLIKN